MVSYTDNVRLAAANMLLDRGVRYTISDAPLSWQLLRCNRINIRPLKAGTLIEIGRIIDIYKLDKISNANEAILKLESIALMIAMAILNKKYTIRFLAKSISKLLLWKVPAKVLITVFFQILQVNKLTDFMSITKYFEHQTQMMMSPKNLGHQQKGS